MGNKPFDLRDLIESVLRNRPETRDNDFYLAYYVTRASGTDPEIITYTEALRRMGQSKLPKYDSITRLRRVVQRDFPELRGDKVKARRMRAEQKKAEARAGKLQLD